MQGGYLGEQKIGQRGKAATVVGSVETQVAKEIEFLISRQKIALRAIFV